MFAQRFALKHKLVRDRVLLFPVSLTEAIDTLMIGLDLTMCVVWYFEASGLGTDKQMTVGG